MKISVLPVLARLRAVYNVEGIMPRFEAYTNLMTKGPEGILPLGAFSPMGKCQPRFLDQLLEIGAEGIAQQTADRCLSKQQPLSLNLQDHCCFPPSSSCHWLVVLVVVDAPKGKNTWTGRYVTDSEWRFEQKYDRVASSSPSSPRGLPAAADGSRFVTVQLWTDYIMSASSSTPLSLCHYIERETASSIFRAVHQHQQGNKLPATLNDMMRQEGFAHVVGSSSLESSVTESSSLLLPVPPLDEEDLEYSQVVLQEHRASDHYPTCFAAMYGDAAAKDMGYKPLGLSDMAGFAVAAVDAATSLSRNGIRMA